MGQFGVGQPVPRFEDPKLTRGLGRYVDDIVLADQAHAFIVRSSHAHARIAQLDVEMARGHPGVLKVLTGADREARGLGSPRPLLPWKGRDGAPARIFGQPQLVTDKVCYVGDPIALVVAETLAAARDAAELIEVEYEPLPVTVSAENALTPGAEPIREECPDNIAFFHALGDPLAVDKAFETADHIVTHRLVMNRVAVNTIEPRGCIGDYDADTGRYTLYVSGQNPHQLKSELARAVFDLPADRFRVVMPDVGGGFGMKSEAYPEYSLCLWASETIGRPVKWIATRSEGIVSDYPARDQVAHTRLALDGQGRFLAFEVKTHGNMGAYFTSERNSGPFVRNLGGLAGTYKTPAIYVEVTAAYTNTNSLGPYRGAGRPEASYVLESTIDLAARQLGLSPVDLRRRNMIAPEEMPYKTGLIFTYDCGEFARNMETCLEMADHATFEVRRDKARANGRLRGIGLSSSIEQAGHVGLEYAEIQFDARGIPTLLMGTKDHGQGHQTAFRQIMSEKLGIAPDDIRFADGDTDRVAQGTGTFGSRSLSLGGTALALAADKVIEKGRRVAADLLEANGADITFEDGKFAVAGTNRFIDIKEVAAAAHDLGVAPDEDSPGLGARATHEPEAPNFPNGCHVCEIEIDMATGAARIVRYSVVDDVGRILNPLLLKGQIHGGIAQGAGQALMEDLAIDPETGQVLSGSFMDYCMPRADDFCAFEVVGNEVLTKTNPLGVKGAGEAGTVGALAAVMSAVNNALAPLGADYVDMPATPQKIWRAIQSAGETGPN